ncbi:MAG: hypothetical protein U0237_10995 [Thermoleophilia bacterium]
MTGEPPRAADEGGEAPCFMDRVCPRCGAFMTGLRCAACGYEAGDEPPETRP